MALPKDQAELDRMLDQARTDARTTAAGEAVTADRTRRREIMALPEAATRQKLATTLADGDYSAEQAKALLSAAAEETVSAPAPTGQQQQQAPTGQQDGNQQQGNQQQGNQQQGNQQQQQNGQSQFERMMDQGGGAGVGQQGNQQMRDGNAPMTEEEQANAILGDQAKLTGHDLRPQAK